MQPVPEDVTYHLPNGWGQSLPVLPQNRLRTRGCWGSGKGASSIPAHLLLFLQVMALHHLRATTQAQTRARTGFPSLHVAAWSFCRLRIILIPRKGISWSKRHFSSFKIYFKWISLFTTLAKIGVNLPQKTAFSQQPSKIKMIFHFLLESIQFSISTENIFKIPWTF